MSSQFTKTEIDASLAEFMQEHAPTYYQEGDVTIQMAMLPPPDGWGLSWSGARDHLNELVAGGILEKINYVILPSRRLGCVWRRVRKAA